jgi:hypothetical protein
MPYSKLSHTRNMLYSFMKMSRIMVCVYKAKGCVILLFLAFYTDDAMDGHLFQFFLGHLSFSPPSYSAAGSAQKLPKLPAYSLTL